MATLTLLHCIPSLLTKSVTVLCTVKPVPSLHLNHKSSYADTKVSFFLSLGKALGQVTVCVSIKISLICFFLVLIVFGMGPKAAAGKNSSPRKERYMKPNSHLCYLQNTLADFCRATYLWTFLWKPIEHSSCLLSAIEILCYSVRKLSF